MDWKIELIFVPVSDVDRAKDFYEKIGFHADHDHVPYEGLRFVQMTPPGSACSIAFGTGLDTGLQPGQQNTIQVVVPDADEALARSTYALLNPHPYRTFTEPAVLPQPLAALEVGKSYLNAQQDTALPHSLPWHPRLSERLGLFRLVECAGSHELCFSNPALLAVKMEEAGRD